MLVADYLSDAAFVRALESLQLDPATFNHRQHLRLAWVYLGRLPLRAAAYRCAGRIREFAVHHGSPRKFHLTMTLAFMHLIEGRRRQAPASEDFAQFCARNPDLLGNARGLLGRYYSAARLNDPAARSEFMTPDLQPLPEMHAADLLGE